MQVDYSRGWMKFKLVYRTDAAPHPALNILIRRVDSEDKAESGFNLLIGSPKP